MGSIDIYMHFKVSFCLVFITGGRCIKFKSHGQLGHRGHGKMLICSTGQDRRISCQEIRLEVNIRKETGSGHCHIFLQLSGRSQATYILLSPPARNGLIGIIPSSNTIIPDAKANSSMSRSGPLHGVYQKYNPHGHGVHMHC